MSAHCPVTERHELHGASRYFRDFGHAGAVLARMLEGWRGTDAVVLGIPAGGALVGAALARTLDLPFELAVAAKVSPPGDSEYGLGAVAFDGGLWLDRESVARVDLHPGELSRAARLAREKVHARRRVLRGTRRLPPLVGRTVILVDDGIATGGTVRATLRALRRAGAGRVIVAAPTGHEASLATISQEAEGVYCANVRSGPSFSVAGAYSRWESLSDHELRRLVPGYWEHFEAGPCVGLRGVGRTCEEAFEQAALALTAVVCGRPDEIRVRAVQTIRREAEDSLNLLASWLEAVLEEGRRHELVFCRFSVLMRGTVLEATASGERRDPSRHAPFVPVRGLAPDGFRIVLDEDRVWLAEALARV